MVIATVRIKHRVPKNAAILMNTGLFWYLSDAKQKTRMKTKAQA